MTRQRLLTWLSLLVLVLAVVAALAGLLWQDGDGRTTVTSVRGERVELYGEGLYRFDTVFSAAGSRGTDLATLLFGVPLLVVALVLHRRRSLPGSLLLAGVLSYFLYVYASRSLLNAYNGLFLVYIALFSASVFALFLAVSTIETRTLGERVRAERPWRGLAAFLVACAVLLTVVWLLPLVSAAVRGDAPKLLDTYTTTVTDVLDLGLIVPTLVVAAVLVLRRDAFGYVLGAVLLVLLVLVPLMIALQTVFQLDAGVEFTPPEIAGPMSGFIVLGAIAVWLLSRLFRAAARGEGRA